jgi:hypothetical protein
LASGFKSGGRDFKVGYDPRRQYHRGPSKDMTKLRRDLFNYYVAHMPDEVLDLLEARGLIGALVQRYETRTRRDPQLGGPKWARGR